MKQKVIIVGSVNKTPEYELEQRIEELGEGWRVVSAQTALALQGTMNLEQPDMLMYGVAKHTYYVTTVIMERV
jgi:hypothetical protein